MQIGGYEIKPIVLTIPDTKEWVARDEKGLKYFAEQGITDIETIKGIHSHKWGVDGKHIYLLDGRPEQQFLIGQAKVGCFLSLYVVYSCMNVMPDSHFLFLETDCQFESGWKDKLEQALIDVPADFDFLFVGSCCAADKQPAHVKGDVYEFPYRGEAMWDWYPQCGHAMIIAKKVVPKVIERCRDTANPIDVALIRYVFPDSKVYAILPRLAHQGSTELPR